MTKFSQINDSITAAERYALAFVHSIEGECLSAAENVVSEVVQDLEFWNKCGKDISAYTISYGIANFSGQNIGIDVVANRCLFGATQLIRKHSAESWKEKSLSLGAPITYHEYELECHRAVIAKVSELVQDKFKKMVENNELLAHLGVEEELTGYFLNRKIECSVICPTALCCLIPIIGWSFSLTSCLMASAEDGGISRSIYHGEALIRIYGTKPEKRRA